MAASRGDGEGYFVLFALVQSCPRATERRAPEWGSVVVISVLWRKDGSTVRGITKGWPRGIVMRGLARCQGSGE